MTEIINVALGKDGDEKEVADPHPTNQMESEAIAVLNDAATGDCVNGWDEVLSTSVEELPFVTHKVIGRLSMKSTGSISNNTKRKPLWERWMTPGKVKDDRYAVNSNEKIIERNVHVKMEVSESGEIGTKKVAVEIFCVFGIYTKT